MVDQAVEAGNRLSTPQRRADQQRALKSVDCAVRPFLIDQHAVDEQFQVGVAEANDHVVPVAPAHEVHRRGDVENAVSIVGLIRARLLRGLQDFRTDPFLPRRGAPLELQAAAAGVAFCLAESHCQMGRVRSVEQIGQLVVGGRQAEQRRIPFSLRVAQADVERHELSGDAQGIRAGGAGDEISAAEFRRPAVAAAQQRRLALTAGEFDAKADISDHRQRPALAGGVPRIGHAPHRRGVVVRQGVSRLSIVPKPARHARASIQVGLFIAELSRAWRGRKKRGGNRSAGFLAATQY